MDPAHIVRFLPENYRHAAGRADGVTAALLAAMDAMHTPVEAVIEGIERYVSPYRAPDEFVLLQASWLGLDRYFDWSGGHPGTGRPSFGGGIGNLRLLLGEAAELMRHRGRRDMLIRFLELATGCQGFAIDDGNPDGTFHPFHLTVRAPAQARPLSRLVGRIVAEERPAHATYDIVFAEPPASPPERQQ